MAEGHTRGTVATFAAGAAMGAATATAATLLYNRPQMGLQHTGAHPASSGDAAWQVVLRFLRLHSPGDKPATSSRECLRAAAEARAQGRQYLRHPSAPSATALQGAGSDCMVGKTRVDREKSAGISVTQAPAVSADPEVAALVPASAIGSAQAGAAAAPLRLPAGGEAAASGPSDEEDEILAEHFTRNTQFFGAEGQRRVAGAFVIVVGLGVRLCPVFCPIFWAIDVVHCRLSSSKCMTECGTAHMPRRPALVLLSVPAGSHSPLCSRLPMA